MAIARASIDLGKVGRSRRAAVRMGNGFELRVSCMLAKFRDTEADGARVGVATLICYWQLSAPFKMRCDDVDYLSFFCSVEIA